MRKIVAVALAGLVAWTGAQAAVTGAYQGKGASGSTTEFLLDDARVRRWEHVRVIGWQPEVSRWAAGETRERRVAVDGRGCTLYTKREAVHSLICPAESSAALKGVVYVRDYPASVMKTPGAQVLRCIDGCEGDMPAQLRFTAQKQG